MYSRKIKKGIDSRQLTVKRYEWPHFGDWVHMSQTDEKTMKKTSVIDVALMHILTVSRFLLDISYGVC